MPGVKYKLSIDKAPASPDLLEAIQEVQVENNSDMADAFRLRIAIGMTSGGEWTILEDDLFKPLTPVEIGVQVGTGLAQPLISGYVVSQNVNISNEPGQSFLEVVGIDATVLMNLEEKVKAWPNMADSDIATAIFNDYGFVPRVDQTQPLRQEMDTTTMQRATDIQFLRRLAKRNGFECYVENDPLLNKDVGHFHKAQLEGTPQGSLSISFGETTNLTSFNVRYEMLRPTTAQASDVDISTKSTQNGKAQTVSASNLGQEGLLDRISPRPVVLISKTGLATNCELQALCQAVVDRSAWAVTAEGELNTTVYEGILRARRKINVRGAGRIYSGTYYVGKILHIFSSEGYTQRFELRRNAIGLTGTEAFVDTGALV